VIALALAMAGVMAALVLLGVGIYRFVSGSK
jgi:hypothetical protein